MGSYLEDFQFVFGEISSLEPLDVMRRPFPEPLLLLPHPSGSGHMHCGLAAYRRLREMAERALSASAFAGRVEVSSVFEELKSISVQRFLKEKRDLNISEADRAVAAAVRIASKKCCDLTHFIPCHIGHEKTPISFALGPVHFQQCTSALERLGPALELYIAADRENSEFLVTDARQYYESFGWIAEVTISSSDPPISRRRARYIVQRALDCLQLLVGADYSHRMRAGGPRFSTDRRAHIEMDPAERIAISVSVDWLANALGDGWWEWLIDQHGEEPIMLIGVALDGAQTFPAQRMAQRFLDGAAWYGEAVRDEFNPSRIVKYVTAIERMLVIENDDKNQIAEKLATRGAALIHAPGVDDLECLHGRFKSVYDMRSRFVHGSQSPLSEDLGEGLREAEALARSTLFRSLALFRREGLESRDANDRHLEQAFRRVLEWANATRKSVEAE